MQGQAAERYRRAAEEALTGRRAQRGRSSDVEAAILDAAEALLAEVRVPELKVTDIIERAGTSRASFYFYFSSKWAVLASLLARSVEEIVEAVQPWVSEEDDQPGDRLCRSIEAAADAWMEHRHILCSVSESWALVEDLEELWVSVIGRFVDIFTEAVEQDVAAGHTTLAGDARELVAALVWGTERAFYVVARQAEVSLTSMEGAVRAVQQMWLATIYGTPTGSAVGARPEAAPRRASATATAAASAPPAKRRATSARR